MKSKRWLGIFMAVLIIFTPVLPVFAGDNLVVNGGFEDTKVIDGVTYGQIAPSTTEYTEVLEASHIALQPPYVYAIGTDPNLYHSSWAAFDPMKGDYMMIVNGSSKLSPDDTTSVAGALVWGQEVSLPPGNSKESFTLYAGRKLKPVGEVHVESDGETVCVEFELSPESNTAGWSITETHVAVANAVSDIPQTQKGNPIPGQFDKAKDNDPWVGASHYLDSGETSAGQYCLEIKEGWEAPFAIAAHAVIEKTDCPEVTCSHEECTIVDTTWGGEGEFDNKNWARYIEYTPVYEPNLFDFSFYARDSYFENPAQLEVNIKGETFDETYPFNLEGANDQDDLNNKTWQHFTATDIDLTGESKVMIEIRDRRFEYTGDDFCLDEISLIQQ